MEYIQCKIFFVLYRVIDLCELVVAKYEKISYLYLSLGP